MNYKNLVHMDQTPIGQTETSANNHQGLVRSCPSLGGPTKKYQGGLLVVLGVFS